MEWISKNEYLSISEMQNNATIIKDYLIGKGWTLNAICGMLGNMQAESTINPGIWQNLDEFNLNGGFGLVQWTPATNYTVWATGKEYPITDGNYQLVWIDEYTNIYGQWISTTAYPLSFTDFKHSNMPAEYLASAFLKNFERAGIEVEEARRSNASYWFTFFGGSYVTPSTPSNPSKKKKFNFILFNRNRRMFV